MSKGLVATASTTIEAPVSKVWNALVDPASIKKYMFGADTSTDWKEGSPIVWKGSWEGKDFEDKGTIVKVEPEHTLTYTHYSSMTGKPDTPENYETVTHTLSAEGGATKLTIEQDGNKSEEGKAKSTEMWTAMLGEVKKLVEG